MEIFLSGAGKRCYEKGIEITRVPKAYVPAILLALVYNHYDWVTNTYGIKAMLGVTEFLLT
jgi:hypothetical protein